MAIKIKLKNREDKFVVIDTKSHEAIQADKHLMSLKFLENLRANSGGYSVFQRCITTKKGLVFETIYLHKYIADNLIKKPESDKKLFVRFIDGNTLNAQIENLEWVTMSTLRRQMKNFKSKSGYRGVIMEKGKFRAIVFHGGESFDLGFHNTAKEAAIAYNKKSIELFGKTNSLNDID